MIKIKTYSIGVDIGGTNMKAVLFDGEKVIVDYLLATPKDDLDHFLIMLGALCEPLMERAKQDKVKIRGIGIGVAGVVDHVVKKVSTASPNLPILKNFKLAAYLENKTGLPVAIDNDANCFLRAEVLLGAASKYKNAYGLTIGTGIGGGWWVYDKIYFGANDGAGEPGRMLVEFSEMKELEKAYQELSRGNAADLAERVIRGDRIAEQAFENIGKYLGMAMANIVNLIDPEVIVIGGSVAEASDLFLSQAKKTMRDYVMNIESKKVKILKGKLGPDAGAIGAALLVE